MIDVVCELAVQVRSGTRQLLHVPEPAWLTWAPPGRPLLAGILHAWHDEARHQGEMYLLHKLCRGG